MPASAIFAATRPSSVAGTGDGGVGGWAAAADTAQRANPAAAAAPFTGRMGYGEDETSLAVEGDDRGSVPVMNGSMRAPGVPGAAA